MAQPRRRGRSAPDATPGIQRVWRHRGAMAWLLSPISLLYGALAGLRRLLYVRGVLRVERLPVPVVVVGNVVAGGAGKTPVTLAVVQALRRHGWHPGVVSRGYGRGTSDCREVLAGSSAAESGDEPLLIARSTGVPVFVAPRRAQAARALLERHPRTDVVVCDDGLQHWALARDVELCVFSEEGIGNGWLLPAGPLRERWPRHVDAVLHAGAAPEGADRAPMGAFALRRSLASHAVDASGSTTALSCLRGRPVHAVAAIARPAAFFAMLRAEGLTLAKETALPDHADFSDWAPVTDPGMPLVCTEKDAAKLWRTHPQALAVPLVVDIPAAFFDRLHARLQALPRRRSL
ncbi:tetraacyldisaccharide 4'-kinase [Paracidovorax citrulli]|uniref:tetraacyldisaccharide 4'-kinase n=1 Tax=Paracidovorax citrulli TaxID=80869 RepID=UPI0006622708|nr:tetraacyldisaccharide 4'-kinase [Paracidovorax citrulli]QCX13141.1 Tetraacyldisaccharide 4'-kinase [Paracidovorax citrulli]UEG48202.1 tetraacyldisaccharide 4'-kinase [Paracidovorax citrulli]UMT88582.1 tetraacyldisaccharide 4'-kinase [Paracidovorax citrulli]UMT96542.1 tetraacyldisaccharide 4'-kinase [Paracidovorax citrulli]WIY36786.1 tetraacyldisaccharide 4'-kinase [Paracidovorax citrulli]